MGKEGVKTLKSLDVKKLIKMLNAALSEEWLAYYQYWLGARLMEGPMRTAIEAELLKHADEELGHATLLVNRIIELDGTPVLSPDEWTKTGNCKYYPPSDVYIETILDDNLKSERCAIDHYKEIADYTDGIDHATHAIATQILRDELEHEQDIEDWIQDILQMKKHLR